MTFFRDLKQDIYPAASIRRMVHHAPPKHNPNAGFYEVDLVGNDTCRVSYETAQNLLRQSWRYITAPPNVVLIELKTDDEPTNDPFHRTAILALAIDEEGGLHPVTAEGITEVQDWGVLSPDGLVSDSFGSSYTNPEAFLENRLGE